MTRVGGRPGDRRGGSPSLRALPAAAAALCALLLAGCHGAAPVRPVDVEMQVPEKDILVYDIEISELTGPRVYRDWAREQLDLLGAEPANERWPGIPIYEVWYRFRLGGETVAEVSFRREPGSAGLSHAQTVVRRLPERAP